MGLNELVAQCSMHNITYMGLNYLQWHLDGAESLLMTLTWTSMSSMTLRRDPNTLNDTYMDLNELNDT